MTLVTTDHPYADAALSYVRNAWLGVLPITGKWPPPTGYTGAEGAWPSTADVLAWCDGAEGQRNIGLRLPPHVIGLDVDMYGGKTGRSTFAEAIERYGELPDTWITTSRDDGSGIRLFAVPPGLRWPGQLGPAVEIIQTRHRYAMVWPSIHPDTGQRYEWITPELEVAAAIAPGLLPHADELAALPEAWVLGLTGGEAEASIAKIDLSDDLVSAWLGAAGKGAPCAAVLRALARGCLELSAGMSRHDVTTRASARLALLAAEGHSGVSEALLQLRAAFERATAGERRTGEWDRMLSGAVKIAAARGVQPLDPCSLWRERPQADPGDHRGSGTTQESLPPPRRPEPLPTPDDDRAIVAMGASPRPSSSDAAHTTPELLHVKAADNSGSPDTPSADTLADPALLLEIATQRARNEARRILAAEEAAKWFTPPPFRRTLAEDLALPDLPIEYRVDQVFPAGGNVLLIAQYKSGKTTLVNHLTKCLADGCRFLGQFDVTAFAGRVAIFNYEVSDAQYRRWLRDSAIENAERVSVLNLRGFSMPLLSDVATEWVIRWLAEHEIAVWVLDPFARAAVGSITSENDNGEVGRLLEHLDVIKQRAGVSELIVPTHTGRAEFEEGAERARGATRLEDWADVRWFLTKDEDKQRFFRATGRDVELDEHGLEYDENTRGYRISGGSRKQSKVERVKGAVIASALNSPGIGSQELRDSVVATLGTAGNDLIDKAVRELVSEGGLSKTRVGHRVEHRVINKSAFGAADQPWSSQ